MTIGLGGGGFIGVAYETVIGTYVAPAKFFPLKSEKLEYVTQKLFRRTIRQSVDTIGVVMGNTNIAGPISIEAFAEVLPYFLSASRNTVVKTVATPNVYTYTPSSAFQAPNKTLSITVVRDGVCHGFVGCVVADFKISVGTDAILMFDCNVVGLDEATQSVPASPVFPVTSPMGAGSYNVQLPTGAQVADVDTFALEVKDNAKPEWRLYTTRAPRFIGFGMREVTFTMERDFQDRTELDAFKLGTAQSTRVICTLDTNDIIQITCVAAVRDTYEISGLSGQGDIIRSSQTRQGMLDAGTGKAYEIIITTLENA